MSNDPTPGRDTPPPTGEPAPQTGGHSSASLARHSAVMASGTLVSRVLGLIRVALLAGAIGLLGPAGNAWQTANTLPNTIYILLAGGVLNVVLVPQLTRAATLGAKGQDLTDRLITLMLVALIGITVVVTAGAAVLTKFYAWSWSGDQLALSVAFAYLCLPQVLFYGLYTLLGQILSSQERFGWFMWAPVVNNVVAIAGLVVFTMLYPEARNTPPGEWTSSMIWWLGGTATLGVVCQAAVLVQPVRASGFRYRPRWGFRGVGLGATSRLALWTLAVIAVSQLGMWLTTNVLNWVSNQGDDVPGKIIYENAFLFFMLPHSLVTLSLVTAMFTQMSRSAAVDDVPALRLQYAHGLRLLGAVIIPISVAMFLLAPAMTGVLLFRNEPAETIATAYVTMSLLVGLPPYAVYILSTRIFHSYQDGRTPFDLQIAISVVAIAGTLLALTVPATWAAVVIGLGQSLGQAAAAVLGVRWVRRRLGTAPLGRVRTTYLSAMIAAAVAAVPTLLVIWGGSMALDGVLRHVVVLGVGGLLYFGCYALVAHRLGITELAEAVAPLLRRLGRGRGGPAAPDAVEAPAGLVLAANPNPAEVTEQVDPAPDGTSDAAPAPDDQFPTDPAGSPEQRKEHGLRGIESGTALGGRYVLEELLASRGDSLEYWSAHDSTLERLVAVTLLPADGEHEQMAHAVLDGARRTAGVDDSRLVRVLDVGLDDGMCWIVEEGLAESESLASLVANRPLPAEEARRIIGEAASGMEAARRRGLHHLYLSPHAVLRTREGVIKVSGVAVAAALEQTEEIPAVEASLIDTGDLVSLLYTGLTGRWPGEDMEGLRSAHRSDDGSLPAPSEVVAGVPGDLDALCRAMLDASYDHREGPQTPGELARQLSPWATEPVAATGPTGPDAPVSGGGAEAALVGTAGASAAATAAQPGPVHDETPAGGNEPADPSYFRPRGAAGAAGATGPDADDPDPDDEGYDDYDGFGAATGPDRTLPPGVREDQPPGSQTGLVLLLLLGVVAIAVVVAVSAFSGFFSGGDDDPSPAAPTAPATSTPTDDTAPTTEEPEETTTSAPANDEPYEAVGASGFDHFGGDEKSDLAPDAVDGDDSTFWRSYWYTAANWGNLKDGVGLAIDLGEEVPVSEVTVLFPEGDYGAEVFVNDEPTDEGGTSLGSDDSASGTWELTADEPVTGRYVIVWFDRAWTGPNGEVAQVSEVTVQ
ncbi:murein biosynthesis integral membrane protein MurJ [Ornithinicoccus hortensis]|uniref:Murein biosynthesis integral membrane protein MurJ n=1 Tax=Ornithinicoccus hortensis TaxID=82346 RepID=A0A542YMZ8_9MICO|nr:murein biosynthesis integral membrane protein MurJ [Ornithinicoccus hortensis]TQL49427.1 murein biosynthesis integral membrane protein MurJ [Ornithinicoccus hortensis]